MPFNGSGAYSPPAASFPNVANTLIESAKVNAVVNDIATALTTCLTKDGQTPATAPLPMGGYRHTGVGDATARTNYASAGQVQDGSLNWVVAGGTADALTATYVPAITALVDGQLCFVRAGAANATTTPTFAPNGLTARTVTKLGGSALVASEWTTDQELILRYKLASTRWELLNPRKIANTEVTGLGTSSTIDTGTSGAKVPLLNGANTWSAAQTFSATETLNAALNEAKGADIASATTTDLGAATGNYVNVTGTTTITGLGTVQAGTRRIVNFNGALTLTHNATSLILPGAANITTAAGDVGTFVSLGSGNWVCTNYAKASGTAVVATSNGLVFLSAQAASASAALTFTSLISSTYNKYMLEFDDIILATNPATLTVQVSTDNGGTWKSTGYLNNFVGFQNGTPTYVAPTTYIQATLSTTSGVPSSGQAWFSNPNSTTNVCMFNGNIAGMDSGSTAYAGLIAGWYNTTGTAINAVRLIASSGNISSGSARLYGVQKS